MGTACRGVYFGVSGRPRKRGGPEIGERGQNAATKLGQGSWQGLGARTPSVSQLARRHRVGLPDAAFYGMEFKRPVDSPPKIVVADRGDAAESLPLPVVFTPLSELAADPMAHITAAGEQRNARGPVQSFETANDGKQFQTASASVRFAVRSGEAFAIADRLDGKFPAWSAVSRTVSFGVQQKVRAGIHATRMCRAGREALARELN
jgi:hypothetical protein